MDDLLRDFLTETSEHIDVVDIELVRLESEPDNAAILRNVFRLVHTIKGTCGFLGLPRLEALAHAAENLMGHFRDGHPVTSEAVTLILATIDRIKAILAELERSAAEPDGTDSDLIAELARLSRDADAADTPAPVPAVEQALPAAAAEPVPAPSRPEPAVPADPVRESPGPLLDTEETRQRTQSVRVNLDTLEHLMTMVSELVLTRNQLLDIARRHEDSAFSVPLQRLSHVTAELQEGVMKTRMQPIGMIWQKLPRVVRDLSAELGRAIDLVTTGAETELDRQVLELIKDPLTHMVRNSADHGIETPAERRRVGKPERGTIRLAASHEGGTITIEVSDDGRGLDVAAIRRQVVEREIATEAELERMTDQQIARFIFHPGFSTAQTVTAVSGRGVGMDVVKTNIELIGGVIDIRTEPGRGTTFAIKIPLTLAIVAALVVSCGGHRFAIPQTSVVEIVKIAPDADHQLERLAGTPVLRLREGLLPIVVLHDLMRLPSPRPADADEEGFVVVTQVGSRRFGMLVDSVFHTEEIVVKPMARRLRHIQIFAGNTILGDGSVVLIVDPNGVARLVGPVEGSAEADAGEAADKAGDGRQLVSLLVFRAGGAGYRAVPLSLVTRLEEIDLAALEWAGGRPLLQYRGRLMPVVPAYGAGDVPRAGVKPLVVFADGGAMVGLVVDEIIDIVEDALDIAMSDNRVDMIGSAIVRGRATEIIDVGHYLPQALETRGASATRSEMARPAILLVDDSQFFREMLTPVLRAAGYRVIGVESVNEALKVLVSDERIDLVVTDVEMPGRDGFDLVAAMRTDDGLANLPVIALAAYATPAALDRARDLGIADFVAKFDRAGLMAAVREVLPDLGIAA